MTQTQILTGHDAIEYAEKFGFALSKHADPTEGARDGLTIDEAREIAAEDPGLVYIDRTLRIDARQYADADDCLAAAEADVAAERGLAGWDLRPRWEDEDSREVILVDLP